MTHESMFNSTAPSAAMTKREYIATHIAAAMCAEWFRGVVEPEFIDVADEAIDIADALLKRLHERHTP